MSTLGRGGLIDNRQVMRPEPFSPLLKRLISRNSNELYGADATLFRKGFALFKDTVLSADIKEPLSTQGSF